jgi:hypothetical protein
MGKTMKHILKKDFSDYDSSSPLLYALLSKWTNLVKRKL